MKLNIIFLVFFINSIFSYALSKEEIETSMLKAESILTLDAEIAIDRLMNDDQSIQTDYYTLSHYLICQKYFKQPDSSLIKSIINFFLRERKEGDVPWQIEGCLLPKVLIGLRNFDKQSLIQKMLNENFAWGIQHYSDQTFQECFSIYVDRVYGRNYQIIPANREYICVDSIENIVKFLYAYIVGEYRFSVFDAALAFNGIDAIKKFKIVDAGWPYTWRDSIEEVWLIYTRKLTNNKISVLGSDYTVVQDSKVKQIYIKFEKMLKNIIQNEPKMNDDKFTQAFHGHFIASCVLLGLSNRYKEEFDVLVTRLISVQKADGHWGDARQYSDGIVYNGGNVWSSPTFWNIWGLYCYMNYSDSEFKGL